MKGSEFKPANSRFGVFELGTLPDVFFRVEHDGNKIGGLRSFLICFFWSLNTEKLKPANSELYPCIGPTGPYILKFYRAKPANSELAGFDKKEI